MLTGWTEIIFLNLRKRDYADWMDRDNLFEWLADEKNAEKITAVAHFGACSATTEKDGDFLMSNNFGYTKKLWNFCAEHNINFVNASSAATYGAGEQGYNDDITVEEFHKLLPLNKYGYSKKLFDDWSFKQTRTPKHWISCKFFNVYGPQEYHKGRMASMVFHTFHQYKENGGVKLFKSHKEGYADGEQLRDFVYIKDVVDLLYYFLTEEVPSGVYNVGTGKARSFKDLSMATMRAASGNPELKEEEDLLYYFLTEEVPSGVYNVGTGKARSFKDLSMATMRAASGNPELKEEDVIEFIPMPEDLRGKYQYFTEAKMDKVKNRIYSYA